MKIPAGIGFHGVEAAGLQLLQAAVPVFGHHAEIMYGAGNDAEGLAVQQELFVFHSQRNYSLGGNVVERNFSASDAVIFKHLAVFKAYITFTKFTVM